MRAADNWESPRFLSIFLALGFLCSQAFVPSHQLRLTPAVRPARSFLYWVGKQISIRNSRVSLSFLAVSFCPQHGEWQVDNPGFFAKVGSSILPAKES
jgi:hypothetical protein